MNILYISDFLWIDVLGGAEINDKEFLMRLANSDPSYKFKISRSQEVKYDDVKASDFIVLSNFLMIQPSILKYIQENKRYIIYEHDHKYLTTRQPNIYKDFIAPESSIVFRELYENAVEVYVQSSFHEGILKSNLGIDNVFVCSGNFWGSKEIEQILNLNLTNIEKKDKIAILDSPIKHKNTAGAIKICQKLGRSYDLIKTSDNFMFINKINEYKTFLFLPETPETLSRVIVEAKMLNCSIMTNANIGASYEPWFSLKGTPLVQAMINRMDDIVKHTKELIDG